eukprot:3498988-Amphidinium_carterae.1
MLLCAKQASQIELQSKAQLAVNVCRSDYGCSLNLALHWSLAGPTYEVIEDKLHQEFYGCATKDLPPRMQPRQLPNVS